MALSDKYYRIQEGDVGTEAISDKYVAELEAENAGDVQSLMDDLGEWQDAAFGATNDPRPMLWHLKEELDELIADPHSSEEWADCFMLLLGAARRYGYSVVDLVSITRDKLEINKKRKWGKPDAHGVVNHLDGSDNGT